MLTDPSQHLVNQTLLSCALERVASGGRQKYAFVPPPDPGAAPGGDPAAAAGGMAPPAGGMAPPPAGNPGGGLDAATLRQVLTEVLAQQGGGAGAGAGGAGGPALKPKIDVNVEMMQIKNMLAKICDALQIPIPAQDMVATPDKLVAMSQGQPTTSGAPAAGGAGGAGAGGPISPISPIGGVQPQDPSGAKAAHAGEPFDTSGFAGLTTAADAVARLMRERQRAGA